MLNTFGRDRVNWLAHIFLSKNSIDYQLGNLLADPLKGRSWAGASQEFRDGFGMHRSIDSFTDSNRHVLKSKNRLGSKGYLRGVVIDVVYDYLLMKNWNEYSNLDLESFIETFYRDATSAIQAYPVEANRFVTGVIGSGVLTSYGSLGGLITAFHRIDHRLSDRVLARESTVGYLPALGSEMMGIEEDFIQFFPQLVAHFKTTVSGPLDEHWLR